MGLSKFSVEFEMAGFDPGVFEILTGRPFVRQVAGAGQPCTIVLVCEVCGSSFGVAANATGASEPGAIDLVFPGGRDALVHCERVRPVPGAFLRLRADFPRALGFIDAARIGELS